MKNTGVDIAEVLTHFDFGGVVDPPNLYGAGLVNASYLVTARGSGTGQRRYILQRINTHVFTDPVALMDNIVHVTDHLRRVIAAEGGDPERETMAVIPTMDGTWLHEATDGSFWRAIRFVEDTVVHQKAEPPAVFGKAAEAFGQFARRLDGFDPQTLHETIPHFHDTAARYQQFIRAVEQDRVGRAHSCVAQIEFARERADQVSLLTDLRDAGSVPLRVTHNDTKLNNVLLDAHTGKGLCVIDLDTVMPGLIMTDFGDAIRYGANTVSEDEPDTSLVSLSLPLFEAFTQGYLSQIGSVLTSAEHDHLAWAARIITFEQGLRFLSDYLDGDRYYPVNYAGHNLDRCRNQFALLADLERHFDQMRQIVDRWS
ncbi:MAG: aminoglycoside phosphotransferase family protein [Propionibacteriaceae bacterium]|jgi:thiamine kinase-like enzyme|nr:aminoglycoside phosphotransferase family protein [Propionibacteriaceae bacterium]